MSDSRELIPEADARAMVRLLADIVATEGGHEIRKRMLMEGLCELVGGDFWFWGLAADYNPEERPVYTAVASGGFSEAQFPKLIVALDNREIEEVVRPLGREIYETQRQVTRLPVEYDPEDVFGREDVHHLWKEADIGLPLVCYRPVSHNSISSIGIYRRFHRPPFSSREAKIVHIVLSEVAWLHEQGWPWESAMQVPQLPARCRMALNLLLEGLSRKEIAGEMNISVHTVSDYVKQIYDFYRVHSHAELLNRFRIGDSAACEHPSSDFPRSAK